MEFTFEFIWKMIFLGQNLFAQIFFDFPSLLDFQKNKF